MKLIKALTVLSLSALVSVSTYAEPNKPNTKPQAKKEQPAAKKVQQNTKAKKEVKKAPVNNTEKQLKRFTDSLKLTYSGIEALENNGQPVINFNYVVQNTSKHNMKQIHWTATYIYNNQAVLVQDVPFTFEKPLKPKQSLPLTFSVPFVNLPHGAQVALSTPENRKATSAQFQAKSIVFTNGTKIEVK